MSRPHPVSIPFTPPEDPSSEAARRRRWTMLLAMASVLALVGLLAAGMISLSRAHRQLDAARGTLEAMTTTHLYQCYVNIGILADSAENGVYSENDRDELLRTILGLLDNIDAQLDRLEGAGQSDELVDRARRISKLLRTQAAELRAYWRSDDREYAARFQRARDEAWSMIREMVESQ